MFRFGVAATVVWAMFGLLLFASRQQEWLPLFDHPRESNHLTLNAIGDTLAGLFAPLAFLWLFVATWMQRQELALQRQELSETRKVLDLQMSELKRSADESKEQTLIMAENLSATLTLNVFKQYKLRLLYIARYAKDRLSNRRFITKDGVTEKSYIFMKVNILPELKFDDEDSIDAVYHDILIGLRTINQQNYTVDAQHINKFESLMGTMLLLKERIYDILHDASFVESKITHEHMEEIKLSSIIEEINSIASKWKV